MPPANSRQTPPCVTSGGRRASACAGRWGRTGKRQDRQWDFHMLATFIFTPLFPLYCIFTLFCLLDVRLVARASWSATVTCGSDEFRHQPTEM